MKKGNEILLGEKHNLNQHAKPKFKKNIQFQNWQKKRNSICARGNLSGKRDLSWLSNQRSHLTKIDFNFIFEKVY